MADDPLALKLVERYEALKEPRTVWQTLWDDIAKYVVPRRLPGMNGASQSPSVTNESLLFDTTAVNANMTLANGQLAWMSPLESPWFAFEPLKQNDTAKRWLADATTTARNELAVSPFYTAVHEFYLDRGAFGTSCIYIEPGRRSAINAQVWPVGSFVIDEDEDGIVDTVIREFTLTARQAEQKFEKDKLPAKITKALEDGGGKAHQKFTFIHGIYPRADADRDKAKMDDRNMPIASVYVFPEEKHVCKESGYEEMPVMVSRYLEWGSNTGGLYGWSPAFAALPEARQVNFLQKMMDALAEKMAFPPVLAPESLEGEIDANAMGVTYFSNTDGGKPEEWMTKGRYDIGLLRIQERQKAIERAFHVDLFQMFAQLQKQMTAREVAERSQEKLIQFSPTFSRLTSELFNPLLERTLGILLRSGRVPMPPPDIAGQPYQIQYRSRIALALQSLPALGYQRSLERLQVVAQIKPDVLDNFDFDRAERDVAMSEGVPPEFLVPKLVVDETRKKRAEAQAKQQQQQDAMVGADVLSKAGRVPADSPVGQALKEQLPG